MRETGGKLWREAEGDMRLPLVVLTGCFLAGGLAGLLFSGRSGSAENAVLA